MGVTRATIGTVQAVQVHGRVKADGCSSSHQPGMQAKTVAAALEIHPFMLSKWRKDVHDGILRRRAVKAPPPGPARQIAQLQALEQRYAELQQEHELSKKAIQLCSAQRAKRSPSSTRTARSSA
ncbi:transposase [Gemmatimonas sp.]|uniref:transposase n=1 Tax=Gemmatimonas sp. TaxID=1962908 RepID=UPI0037C0ED9B